MVKHDKPESDGQEFDRMKFRCNYLNYNKCLIFSGLDLPAISREVKFSPMRLDRRTALLFPDLSKGMYFGPHL